MKDLEILKIMKWMSDNNFIVTDWVYYPKIKELRTRFFKINEDHFCYIFLEKENIKLSKFKEEVDVCLKQLK